MAYPTEPRIKIDDLAPHATLGGYHATWQEGGMVAHAYLEPFEDQPARGYILETTYQTKSGREPGPRQREQGARLAAKLRENMTEQMIDAGWQPAPIPGTGKIGWQHESRLKRVDPIKRGELVAPKRAAPVKPDGLTIAARQLDQGIIEHQAEHRAPTTQPHEIKQDRTGAGLQPAQRVLSVAPHEGKRQFKTYSRTLAPMSVTFTCSRCHREATRSQYPGRVPCYCEPCAAIIKREKTRERVARLRAGQKAEREGEAPATTAEDRKQILLRKRGDGTYRIHQVEVDRWTAEARSPLTRGKWIPLSDEKLRIRLFASIDEAFQAVEANRRDMKALHLEMEEYSKRNAN